MTRRFESSRYPTWNNVGSEVGVTQLRTSPMNDDLKVLLKMFWYVVDVLVVLGAIIVFMAWVAG